MNRLQTLDLNQISTEVKKLASHLRGGEILALVGPLGSGKTTFTQALAKQLGIKHKVTSPTFTLMNRFEGKLPSLKKPVYFYHLDLYRTKNFREVKALGLTEIWGQPNTITIIEWADKIKKHWPKKTQTIIFQPIE